MENITIRGRVYKIFDAIDITDRFRKQELVLQVLNNKESGTYTDYIKFQCINAKTSLLDTLEKGDMCIIKYIITGRKYNKDGNELFFTNLDIEDLTVITRASDDARDVVINSDNDYSDLIPGLNKQSKDPLEDMISDNKEEDEENDLPF